VSHLRSAHGSPAEEAAAAHPALLVARRVGAQSWDLALDLAEGNSDVGGTKVALEKPPPPLLVLSGHARTNRTRRVPHPVLIGHGTKVALEKLYETWAARRWGCWQAHGPMQWDLPAWTAVKELMGSPLTFSRKLEDVSGCATVLQRLARIERLPPGDGREALAVLRVAWDKTDLFNSLAGRYKVRPPPLCPQLTPPAPPLSPSCLLHAPGASWVDAARGSGG